MKTYIQTKTVVHANLPNDGNERLLHNLYVKHIIVQAVGKLPRPLIKNLLIIKAISTPCKWTLNVLT